MRKKRPRKVRIYAAIAVATVAAGMAIGTAAIATDQNDALRIDGEERLEQAEGIAQARVYPALYPDRIVYYMTAQNHFTLSGPDPQNGQWTATEVWIRTNTDSGATTSTAVTTDAMGNVVQTVTNDGKRETVTFARDPIPRGSGMPPHCTQSGPTSLEELQPRLPVIFDVGRLEQLGFTPGGSIADPPLELVRPDHEATVIGEGTSVYYSRTYRLSDSTLEVTLEIDPVSGLGLGSETIRTLADGTVVSHATVVQSPAYVLRPGTVSESVFTPPELASSCS